MKDNVISIHRNKNLGKPNKEYLKRLSKVNDLLAKVTAIKEYQDANKSKPDPKKN